MLSPGDSRLASIRAGEAHAYSFVLETGWFAGITVDQQGADVAVSLRDPGGRLLASVDSPHGSRVPEILPVVGEVSGTYDLEVRSVGDPGSYEVRIDPFRRATSRDRTRVAAERLLSEGEELRRKDDSVSLRAAVTRQRQAARLFEELGEPEREAEALYSLAGALYSLEDNAGALDAYGQALPLFREAGRQREAIKALNGLGRTYRALGETAPALERYREALKLARSLGDRQQEALTLNNLGRTWQTLGETEQALGHYEQALPLWRQLGRRSDEADTLFNLGDLYQSAGEPDKALGLLARALALYEEEGSLRDAAATLNILGNSHARTGNVRAALGHLRKALEIQRKIGDRRSEAQTLNDLGWCQILAANPGDARRSFSKALALYREVGDRPSEAVALANVGWADDELGRPRPAIRSFEEALPVLVATGNRGTEAMVLLGLARSRRRLGELHAARGLAEQALARIESLRGKPAGLMRASFLATKQEFFGFTLDLLMELHRREPRAGHDARALAVSEEARARSLLDMLAQTPQREAVLPRPLTLPEIQREVVDAETVLLQYALTRERSFLWVVTPESLSTFELPSRTRIEEAARRVHDLVSVTHQSLARGRAALELADLSRVLLGPAAGLLEGKRLVVVPDGALHYVPFAALTLNGEPLIARHEVVTLPSASSLALIRRKTADRPPAPGVLAVVADPVHDTSDPRQGRLPGSREEAEAILSLVPPGERLGALGLEASRETVLSGRLGRYRVVHFATHGLLNGLHPELSGLLLTQGYLHAYEIYGLSLPADLVVLSACRTALGREIRGEGLVGLTRGFLHAGAKGVLVSLWDVEDRATAELMRRFYRELLEGGRPPAAALRAAQASLRREPGWEAPYFWAGFILQGDWHAGKPFATSRIYAENDVPRRMR